MRERLLLYLLKQCERQMLHYADAIQQSMELEEMQANQYVYDYWHRLYMRIVKEIVRCDYRLPKKVPVVTPPIPHKQVQMIRYRRK